jgi:hypothetical protein
MVKYKEVQIVKVPALYLIMDGDSVLGHAKREFQVSEVCKQNGWRAEAVQEFGGWLKALTYSLKSTYEMTTKPKPTKRTSVKPKEDVSEEA